ncbi:MAG: hypothetical protein KF856_14070 [Cyclobacteriaceae bacterium]|nr:hypothetical protein [Cyclobacteriaceae bacterium]
MTWSTLYISGKPGFKEAILDKLSHPGRFYLPGSFDTEHELLLYWIDSNVPLRNFKNEIGSKLIFKYRLRFHAVVPEESTDTRLSVQEKALVKKMAEWEEHYRHSA